MNFHLKDILISKDEGVNLKIKKSDRRVWCFIGDMTFETGIFYEAYKYKTNLL